MKIYLTTNDYKAGYDTIRGFSSGTVIKNSPANEGDIRDSVLIPRLGESTRVGNGNPLHILGWKIPKTEGPAKL